MPDRPSAPNRAGIANLLKGRVVIVGAYSLPGAQSADVDDGRSGQPPDTTKER
jgi:hypothetical protein